jgi:hypothetical protein
VLKTPHIDSIVLYDVVAITCSRRLEPFRARWASNEPVSGLIPYPSELEKRA